MTEYTPAENAQAAPGAQAKATDPAFSAGESMPQVPAASDAGNSTSGVSAPRSDAADPGMTGSVSDAGTSLSDTPATVSDAADASTDGTSGGITADQARIALRRVKDPELNLNIVDLGLVYDVAVDGSAVRIDMSLTSPGCPSGPEIMGEAEKQLRTLPGVSDVVVNLVWSPPWTPERIEPRVRAYMGF